MENLMKRFFSGGNYLDNKNIVLSNLNNSSAVNKSKFEDAQDELNSFQLDKTYKNKFDGQTSNNVQILKKVNLKEKVDRPNPQNPTYSINSTISPQPKISSGKLFPTYDTFMQTAQRTKPQESPMGLSQNALNTQMLEEKIKLLETKQNLLESINKSMFTSVKEPSNIDKQTDLNQNILNFLNEMKKDITDNIIAESLLNKEAFSKIDLEVKKFKGEVLIHLEQIDNRHRIHSDNIKYILEHSGSRRLNQLSQRVLGENSNGVTPKLLEIGEDLNKISKRKFSKKEDRHQEDLWKYKKPSEEEVTVARREIRRRTTLKKNKLLLTVNEETEKDSAKSISPSNFNADYEKREGESGEYSSKVKKVSVLTNKDFDSIIEKNKNHLSHKISSEDVSVNQKTSSKSSKKHGSSKKTLGLDKHQSSNDEDKIARKSTNKKIKKKIFDD